MVVSSVVVEVIASVVDVITSVVDVVASLDEVVIISVVEVVGVHSEKSTLSSDIIRSPLWYFNENPRLCSES